MSRLLVETGEALYGPRWQTELARALNVSDRTMRRWVADAGELPPGVIIDLLRICMERAAAINAVIDRLQAELR